MKRKTAMMELIDYMKELSNHIGLKTTYSEGLKVGINKAQSLLEKEKEQVMDAFDYNQDSGYSPDQSKELAEEYYNETYKQD